MLYTPIKRSQLLALGFLSLLAHTLLFANTNQKTNIQQNDEPQTPVHFSQLSNQAIGDYLGWHADSDTLTACHGYYLEPPIVFTGTADAYGTKDPDKAPITLTAGSSDYRIEGRSSFHDTVILTQPTRQIIADDAFSYRDDDGALTQINMLGHVHFREPGRLIVADTAYVPIKADNKPNFDLYNVIYRTYLGRLTKEATDTTNPSSPEKITELVAWGTASQAHQDKPGIVTLRHATYSTCPPNSKSCAWHVYGNKVVLNDNTGRGHILHSVLWIKHLPVFYMPYFSFPLNKDRQSGFLFPTIFSSSNSGFGFSTPYYFNLAPNYDLTLTPYYYQDRGTLLQSAFRFLTPNSHGQLDIGYLPHDREFADFKKSAKTTYADSDSLSSLENSHNERWSLHAADQTGLSPNWLAGFEYNRVSDDYYTEDFPNAISQPASDQLLQEGHINYFGEHWTFNGLLQDYQTLHPVDEDDIENQYARLPELSLTGDFPNQYHDLEFLFASKFDYFYKKADPGDTTDPTTGDRINLRPGISDPIIRANGYFIPTAQFDMTAYQLTDQNQSETDDNPASPSREVPIFNIDSGLYFQREAEVFHRAYTQTLEPRLYYLYVPYHNQDDLPTFDTVLNTLNYQQLFTVNRFSSVDRIGDANQVSYGVTSRYIDNQTGKEKLSLSTGQILYFRNRDVSLCDTTECRELNKQTFSPFVGQAVYHLSSQWSASTDLSYDSDQDIFENASANLSYHPGLNQVINLGYNYVHEGDMYTTDDDTDDDLANLSQIHFSYAWPLNHQWSTLGSVDLDTRYGSGVSYLFGVSYSGCCWGVRTYIDRRITGVENGDNQYDNAFFVQFVLKGLSTVGNSDPSGAIANQIAGYQDTFAKENL